MSPKGDRGPRQKDQSFIDIRIRGRMRIFAKTQEEATEEVRRRIMDEILTKHPTFAETGLPPMWEEWLDNMTGRMLGVEVRKKDGPIDEDIEISWSNIKGGKMYKDGPLSHGVDKRRKKRQARL